jgi:lipoyl synthase
MQRTPKPEWLKVRPPSGPGYNRIKAVARDLKLATVCEEAKCPNIAECWAGGTATFMLMGDTCTRGCRFCSIKTGNPHGWLDLDEPQKIAETVYQLGLKYVVLTAVDRDDLPDGGANHFAKTVEALKSKIPNLIVETLIPDFQGQLAPIQRLMASNPDVIAQNIETVERLTYHVRDRRAGYGQTLELLQRVKRERPDIYTKSSIMLGLGEIDDEVKACMAELRAHEVDILTLGQYLQPTLKQLPVERFITPEDFKRWEALALDMGFLYCASGPLVRSSYKAGEFFIQGIIEKRRKDEKTPLPV